MIRLTSQRTHSRTRTRSRRRAVARARPTANRNQRPGQAVPVQRAVVRHQHAAPHDHPHHAREILSAVGYDDEFITNVESHSRVWEPARTQLQKTLLAVDEMTGFIIACALVRPDRSLDNLEVKSVMKKMKDKAFARAVNRETLTSGAADMGVDFAEHVAFLTQALAAAVKLPEYQELPLV